MEATTKLHKAGRAFLVRLVAEYGPRGAARILRQLADEIDDLVAAAEITKSHTRYHHSLRPAAAARLYCPDRPQRAIRLRLQVDLSACEYFAQHHARFERGARVAVEPDRDLPTILLGHARHEREQRRRNLGFSAPDLLVSLPR
jgi:hypothetical protein